MNSTTVLILSLILLSLSDAASIAQNDKILSPDCNFFGYFHNNKCRCISGTFGEKCDKYVAEMCEEGICPYPWMHCAFFLKECYDNPNCLDKRGWCMPLNEVPYTKLVNFNTEEELYFML